MEVWKFFRYLDTHATLARRFNDGLVCSIKLVLSSCQLVFEAHSRVSDPVTFDRKDCYYAVWSCPHKFLLSCPNLAVVLNKHRRAWWIHLLTHETNYRLLIIPYFIIHVVVLVVYGALIVRPWHDDHLSIYESDIRILKCNIHVLRLADDCARVGEALTFRTVIALHQVRGYFTRIVLASLLVFFSLFLAVLFLAFCFPCAEMPSFVLLIHVIRFELTTLLQDMCRVVVTIILHALDLFSLD